MIKLAAPCLCWFLSLVWAMAWVGCGCVWFIDGWLSCLHVRVLALDASLVVRRVCIPGCQQPVFLRSE